jgi:hypothetical protein
MNSLHRQRTNASPMSRRTNDTLEQIICRESALGKNRMWINNNNDNSNDNHGNNSNDDNDNNDNNNDNDNNDNDNKNNNINKINKDNDNDDNNNNNNNTNNDDDDDNNTFPVRTLGVWMTHMKLRCQSSPGSWSGLSPPDPDPSLPPGPWPAPPSPPSARKLSSGPPGTVLTWYGPPRTQPQVRVSLQVLKKPALPLHMAES